MNTRRNLSMGCAGVLGIAILGMIAGAIVGWVYGNHHINSIAEEVSKTNPNDPLDMLPFILFYDIIFGGLIGIVVGVITGVIINFKLKGQVKVQETTNGA